MRSRRGSTRARCVAAIWHHPLFSSGQNGPVPFMRDAWRVLRELGVHRMKLLGSPRRMPSMTGYGLEVTGFAAPD